MTSSDRHHSAVSSVLPPAAAAWVRGRARAPGAGDESPARSARILVRRGAGAAAPIGRILARWDAPEGSVTVHRIGWDAANGGGELAVRPAVAQLGAGSPE